MEKDEQIKQLLDALIHTLEILDLVKYDKDLQETICNAHANYFNLIQEIKYKNKK